MDKLIKILLFISFISLVYTINTKAQVSAGHFHTAGFDAISIESAPFGDDRGAVSFLFAAGRKDTNAAMITGLLINSGEGFFRASFGPGITQYEESTQFHLTYRAGFNFRGISVWVGSNFGNRDFNRGFVNLTFGSW